MKTIAITELTEIEAIIRKCPYCTVGITDLEGNALSWASSGGLGFRGSKKSTPFAAQTAGGGPGQGVALRIGDGDDGVIERRADVRRTALDELALLALAHDLLELALLLGCHCFSLRYFTKRLSPRNSSELLGGLLLASDGLLRALAGTRVLLGVLTANGQTTAMTHTAIAADFHQTLDVHPVSHPT